MCIYIYMCVCVSFSVSNIYYICANMEPGCIESTHVRNPFGMNLLPKGTESLRIETVQESRTEESKTNSFQINSLYKKPNRNRQKILCMYGWMYVCMNVCMYECMYAWMYVCMYV